MKAKLSSCCIASAISNFLHLFPSLSPQDDFFDARSEMSENDTWLVEIHPTSEVCFFVYRPLCWCISVQFHAGPRVFQLTRPFDRPWCGFFPPLWLSRLSWLYRMDWLLGILGAQFSDRVETCYSQGQACLQVFQGNWVPWLPVPFCHINRIHHASAMRRGIMSGHVGPCWAQVDNLANFTTLSKGQCLA